MTNEQLATIRRRRQHTLIRWYRDISHFRACKPLGLEQCAAPEVAWPVMEAIAAEIGRRVILASQS